MVAVWAEFREEGRDRTLPNMFTMVSVGLVVPLNTACVERGFSHHGIIKNKLRNSLKVLQMDSLLRVNVTELSTQGTTTGTGTWLSVTSMRDSTHVYNNGQAAPVHQHSGYKPLHAHGICLTAHTHPSNSTRPKSKHTKSYCQPLTLLQGFRAGSLLLPLFLWHGGHT